MTEQEHKNEGVLNLYLPGQENLGDLMYEVMRKERMLGHQGIAYFIDVCSEAIIKAGWKSPEEVAFFTADVAKAEGYVKLAEDQTHPTYSFLKLGRVNKQEIIDGCRQADYEAGWRKV